MIDLTWIMWFLAGSSVFALAFLLATRPKDPTDERLNEISSGRGKKATGGVARRPGPLVRASAGNSLEALASRQIRRNEKQSELADRLAQAGLYIPAAVTLFTLLRVVLAVAPMAAGYLAGRAGYLPINRGIFSGLVVGMAGTLAQSFWLDHLKRVRQSKLRRSLPDALDVMVVCLQGG